MNANDAYRIVVDPTPTEADIETIERNLTAYNDEKSGPDDQTPLAVFMRGTEGGLIGGLTGYTKWRWLYVDCLWLPVHLRNAGLGSRILEAAERAAVGRGCGYSRLFTYSFQALGFYERLGYTLFGTLEDYPPGHCQHWLRKTLG